MSKGDREAVNGEAGEKQNSGMSQKPTEASAKEDIMAP